MLENRCTSLIGFVGFVAFGACSDEGAGGDSNATSSSVSTSGGSPTTTTGQGITATATSGSGATTGLMSGWCPVQGAYSATVRSTLRADSCQTVALGPTSFDVTIDGTSITFVKPVEGVPMPGSVDGDCHVQVTYILQDLTRTFELTINSALLTGEGTYTEGDPDCPWVYDVVLTFTPS